MPAKPLAIATALALGITSAAWAQTSAGGGSAEGNMNNPASVKSNSEKREERAKGTTGAMSDPTMAPAAGAPAATGPTIGTKSSSGAR